MPLTSPELMDKFLKEQEKRHNDPEAYRGWKTGVADLDKVTGGLSKGWYFVVAGKRKSGKTSFMTTLRTNLGDQGVKFLSISLEEGNLQIAERQVSNVEDVDRSLFRDVKLTQEDWGKVYSAAGEIREWQGHWDYGVARVDEIKRLAEDLEVDVVLIDYIQLMSFPGNNNRTAEIAHISRSLKLMTLEGFTVVAAAQLNDDGDYLWSRDIGRDADVAIKLSKAEDPYGKPVENRLVLDIADSRHSAQDEFEVMFNGARSLVGSFAVRNLDDIVNQ
jgi:replicative DNA helicase